MGSRAWIWAVCLWASASVAHADPTIDRLLAALGMARHGIDQQAPGYTVTALEILSSMGTAGPAAQDLRETWITEAKFAARGDPSILRRLENLSAGSDPQKPGLWIGPFAEIVSLPSHRSILAVVVRGGQLQSGRAGSAICAPDPARPACIFEPAPVADKLRLSLGPAMPDATAFVFLGKDGAP